MPAGKGVDEEGEMRERGEEGREEEGKERGEMRGVTRFNNKRATSISKSIRERFMKDLREIKQYSDPSQSNQCVDTSDIRDWQSVGRTMDGSAVFQALRPRQYESQGQPGAPLSH